MNWNFLKICALLAMILVVGSCKEEEENRMPRPNLSSPLACLNAFGTTYLGECNTSSTSSTICEVIYHGKYELTPASRSYMMSFCLVEGEEMSFTNHKGETANFEVTKKRFGKNARTFNPLPQCPNDPDKRIRHCIDQEFIDVILESTDLELGIEISLDIQFEIGEDGEAMIGEQLSITRKTSANSGTIDFSILINKGTLDIDENPGEIHLDNVELNGDIYTDVFSNTPFLNSKERIQFYYNEFGLIGFTDFDGVTWSRKW